MSVRRIRSSNLTALLAVVLAVTCLLVTFSRPGARSASASGAPSASASRSWALASALTTTGLGTPVFVRKSVKPLGGSGLFKLITFKNSGEVRGVCTSTLVGLQYENTTSHAVDFWSDNLDAASGGYSGGPWSPGGIGGESYTGAITWILQVATGSGTSAQFASFEVTGFHDGPHSGCNFQIQGAASLAFSTF